MLPYSLKSIKNTESKNRKTIRTKNRRTMLYSTFLVCNSKNLKFLKEQEARG